VEHRSVVAKRMWAEPASASCATLSGLLALAVGAVACHAATPTWAEVAQWPDLTGGVWDSGGGFAAQAAAAASRGAPPGSAIAAPAAAAPPNPTATAVQAGRNRAAQLPLTAAGKAQYEKFAQAFGRPYYGCEPFGFPAAFDGGLEFHYTRDVIFIHSLKDYITVTRRIYMDGRQHGEPEPTWMGHAIGHWEGSTLVVDTVGLNDEAQIIPGLKGSYASHAVERFTLAAPDSLKWELSFDNPEILTKPYTNSRMLKLRRGKEVPEAYCTNNLDVEGLDLRPPP
jgi:hypothetical protein